MAVFIDHLDTGHAMGHKVIAAEHPGFGQQATRSSLARITEAGHLRWIKEHITVEDNTMRWVTRTYWSRTRRSAEWNDCRSLAPLADAWLSRGATPKDITRALTDGLPPSVANPGGFARRRLETKMPAAARTARQGDPCAHGLCHLRRGRTHGDHRPGRVRELP
ncbi:hypothetical protein SUDANB145_03467 [Streptomyces sp. enrichment culture]|uniref:hypothetical protein n=1 Tax=Streptomyces sp. enrichment culture TaxID=1795815 RepID=UPI003F57F6D2